MNSDGSVSTTSGEWRGIPTKEDIIYEQKRLDVNDYFPPDPSFWFANSEIPPCYCYLHFNSFEDLIAELDGEWKRRPRYEITDAEFFDAIGDLFYELDRFPTQSEIWALTDVDPDFGFQYFTTYSGLAWDYMKLCFAIREDVRIPHGCYPSQYSLTGTVRAGFSQDFFRSEMEPPHDSFYIQYMRGTSQKRSYFNRQNRDIDDRASGPSRGEKQAAAVLGIDVQASNDTVRDAFRKKVLETHPDSSTGGEDAFMKVKEAYEILIDDNGN